MTNNNTLIIIIDQPFYYDVKWGRFAKKWKFQQFGKIGYIFALITNIVHNVDYFQKYRC